MSPAQQTIALEGIAFDRTGGVLTLGLPLGTRGTGEAAPPSTAPRRGVPLVLGLPPHQRDPRGTPLVLGIPRDPKAKVQLPTELEEFLADVEEEDEQQDEELEAEEGEAPYAEAESAGLPVEEGAPAWVMTFGDLMSLLLTFFILLFSMSSIQEDNFRAMAASMGEAFLGPGNPITLPGPELLGGPPAPVPSQPGKGAVDLALEELAERFRAFASALDADFQITVDVDDEGLYVRIPNAGVFSPGVADLEDGAERIIEGLGAVVAAFDFPVIVSGHTDDVPIASTQFPSNWELSGARAAGVARLLLETGVPSSDLTVRANGEYEPLASNDTPEGRAQNRRVELFYSRDGIRTRLEERGELVGESADAPSAPPTDPTPPSGAS